MLSSIHRRVAQEVEWDLDFPLLAALEQRTRTPTETLTRCCCCALASSAAARLVQRLAVTIGSVAEAKAVAEMFSTARMDSLHTLDLTLHDVAFIQDDTNLVLLLCEATKSAASLVSLRVMIVPCDMQRELQWNHTSVATLAAMIPPTLQVLSLEYLSLQRAREEDLRALSDVISCCHAITHLSLRGTRGFLTRVAFLRDVVAGMRQLSVVDLGSTLLNDVLLQQFMVSLKTAIGGWYRLRQLNLSQSNVSAWGLQLMLRDLGELRSDEVASIEVLNLSSNGIDDDGAFVLASCCMRCEELRELHLRHNRLTKKSASAMGSALIAASSFCCINFHSNPLGDEGLSSFLQYAKYWPELRRLDVTRCRLTARCLPALSTALPLFDRLEEFVLDRNDLRQLDAALPMEGDDSSSSSSVKMSQKKGDLPLFVYDPRFMQGGRSGDWKVPTSFELDRRDAQEGRCRYTGTEEYRAAQETAHVLVGGVAPFELLGSALAGCRELHRLSLSGCALTDMSFTALANALVVRRLAHLDLSSNPLFAHMQSLEALSELLHQSAATLQTLDLSCTGLGSIGASLLADGSAAAAGDAALCSLKTLTQLKLSSCRIGADGLEALADALPSMVSLERLFLDGNSVSELGAVVSVLGACEELPSLRFVGLHGCIPPCSLADVEASNEYVTLQRRGIAVHV
ncbi:putative leucine-rich repeat protein (LRRP) [Trypanosoma grayi]|uniref:putative leucine-rich repeat protein (LRRP) n=1 Tax=Trypanosoma grayi TaxID=71804 RepID=UPI0004F40DA0|nr:putative leucine-rich repeat protein (LRRP) [Trypanosoma grayi]KEG11962.1 putative leucine-rich repeat protein (LRRP) [Trypanosoma grayi]